MKHLRPTCLGFIAASLLAGCASTDKPATTDKTAAAKEEYVRYTPTGSWISIKDKKKKVQPTEQETIQAQMAIGDLQRKGNQTKREP